MIYKEKQRVAAEKAQIAKDKAEYEAWKASNANAKKNPLDYLSKAGLSYDELTQFMLNGGKPTEDDKLEAILDEFGQFKKQIEEEKQKAQEYAMAQQQQAQAAAIDSLKEDIKSTIEANKETYELLSTRGAEDEVYNHLRDSFRLEFQKWVKGGKQGPAPQPMSPEQAAKEMEEFYEQEVERLAQTKKMQGKFQPQPPTKAGEKPKPSPTLTNQMTSSAAASMLPAKNEADRMQRALAKLGS
jgi:hypothetical protein